MNGAVSDLINNSLLVIGALFPIVNPIGNTPIFISMTRGLSDRGRNALARMVAVSGLILILASIFIGTHILAFFGISLPVVQVGGGLIVITTGWTCSVKRTAMATKAISVTSVRSRTTQGRHSIP
jgi:multiple antibiotic resistance protein